MLSPTSVVGFLPFYPLPPVTPGSGEVFKSVSLTAFLMSAARPPWFYLPRQVRSWDGKFPFEFACAPDLCLSTLYLFDYLRDVIVDLCKSQRKPTSKEHVSVTMIFFFIRLPRQSCFCSRIECVSCRSLKGSLCGLSFSQSH